jgi:cytochrome P450
MTVSPRLDLTDLDLFTDGDIHSTFAWLRRHDPVYWNGTDEATGFWALTRHADVALAYADATHFSSRNGTVLGGSYRRAVDSASGQMLIASDAPQHRLLRQQVHPAFGPAMLERAAEVVRRHLGAALDQAVRDGGTDMATLAQELPAGLLSAMFGLDRDRALHLLGLTRTMIGYRDPRCRGEADETMSHVRAQVSIFDLMSELVEERRRDPGTDLVSILLAARLNGRPMTDGEILYNCLNVAVGGDETTPFTAAAAVEAFIQYPDQLDRLGQHPDQITVALNEIFRWTSTNAYVQRTATVDLEIGGRSIAAGQSVTLWNVSANFDEEVFAEPTRFDVGREPNRHLAFGVGPHRCVGQAAAWMEIEIFVRELVRRRLTFELAGPVHRLRSNFMLGATSMPVHIGVRG